MIGLFNKDYKDCLEYKGPTETPNDTDHPVCEDPSEEGTPNVSQLVSFSELVEFGLADNDSLRLQARPRKTSLFLGS